MSGRLLTTCLAILMFCLTVKLHADDQNLIDAVRSQDVESVELLLESGADANAEHVDGSTALHWAVHQNNERLTKLLVAAGADVTHENRYGVPPLSLACTNGSTAIIRQLLNAGADANTTLRGGETVLMTAARTGSRKAVEALIEHGANVEAKDRKEQTAIMWAAAEGNTEVVDALIEAGADHQAELKSGFTPLFFAVRQGHTSTVFRLLDEGLDIKDGMTPKAGLGKGPKKGTSPLILAVENGHFELAAELLEAGADPNDRRVGYGAIHAMTWVRKPIRGDGDPPPIGSGSLSSLDFVRTLIAHGADVNLRHGKHKAGNALDKTDATAFLLAAETGDLPLIKLLLELGADPTLPNKDGVTPLLAAAGVGILSNGDETAGTEQEAIDAIALLLSLGADINAVDEHGETAMHGAAYKSWTNLIAFLAENGADPSVWNTKNNRGWTPMRIAQGKRPGNFRPSAETIRAIEQIMPPDQSDGD